MTAERADLLHAIYERITVAGPESVGVRLTAAAYAHGLALALPEKVAVACPTGAWRALDPIGSCQASSPQLGSKSWPLRHTPQTRLSALRMQWPSAFIFDFPAARLRA